MADRPLGIEDLYHAPINLSPDTPEFWVWCRAHEQARKNTERCTSDEWTGVNMREVRVKGACITIAPFASEREANRLGFDDGRHQPDEALGMEMEL